MASAPHLWAGFQTIVDRLEKHGVPRPSPAWMAEVERYYMHPTALVWVGCVGRGGGKNLVGILCDLTELLFQKDFGIPPGERHYHVHVSENTTEAKKTLRQMAQYLVMLRIPHHATADTIEFEGTRADRGCKVLAARVGANSGFRSTGGTTQESAKWSGDDAANPAEEIVTSWAAQMVTHASARKRHFSTPMGREGFFYDALARGETDTQIITQGPTWKFNPSVTEETTRALAPDPRVWRREYCGEPQAGAMSAFDADEIDAAIAHPRPEGAALGKHLVIDASSGRKDAFTYSVMGWVAPPRDALWRPYLHVYLASEVPNEVAQKHGSDAVVGRIAGVAQAHGITTVHGDQREALFIRGAFGAHGLAFVQHDWTAKSKPAAVERVRTWLREHALALPAEPAKLRRELLSFEEKITPSGQFTFAARGSGHDDYAALLVTAAMAQLEGSFVAGEVDSSCRIGPGNGRASLRAA